MEARHVELDRFARKASSYKRALEIAPHARDLELAVGTALILGGIRHRGWDRRKVRIVDLMAGTGAMSRALRAAGMIDVSAIEGCPEMLPPDGAGIRFIESGAFRNIGRTLREREPQVIVVVAGLHHLVERSGKDVDRLRSVASQLELIDACVDSLGSNGFMVILDIAESESLAPGNYNRVVDWDASAFHTAKAVGDQTREKLLATRSLEEYESVIRDVFGERSNDSTLKWFREVVDPGTTIGHDDVALGSPLLRILKLRYGERLRLGRFQCPWVFETEEHARNFVLQKFGFYVDRAASDVDPSKVWELVTKYLEPRGTADGKVSLSWSLLACVVEGPVGAGRNRALLTVLMLALALLMLMRTIGNVVAGEATAVDAVLSSIVWIIVGLVVGFVVEDLRRHIE